MNLVDYLMGGGEGCVFGGYLCFRIGIMVKGQKICNNKKYFMSLIIFKCKLKLRK